MSTSQKQAIIKLIGRKDKDKQLIKNWRPTSLLNVETKTVSKVLAEGLKNALPSLISSNQTAYWNGRFISEGGRLISDIEKAFDSVDHNFLLKVLENYDFSQDFLKWIVILLQNQKSCVINGNKTTCYFTLKRGTRQDDPILAYLFILVSEIVFIFI